MQDYLSDRTGNKSCNGPRLFWIKIPVSGKVTTAYSVKDFIHTGMNHYKKSTQALESSEACQIQ